MNRRELLKNGFCLTGGLWLSQLGLAQKALAATDNHQRPQFLVQLVLNNGWHTSLSVDPWILPQRLDEKDAFIEYLDNEVFRQGEINLGPAMASMQKFAPQLNIINGIFLSASDNGHSAAQIYSTTGKGSGEAASIAAEYALSKEKSILGVLSKGSLYKGSSAVPFTSVGDLKAISTDDSIDLEFRNPTSVISKALLSKRANLPKFTAMNEEIQKLAAQKITLNDGHYIAAAFKEGLANSSSYMVEADSGTLDSHSDHPGNHMRAQKNMWEQIANIISAFKEVEYEAGVSLFDLTTFFITSDFSRTPALDSSKGTNHNPLNNSAVIIGPGFKGNSTFGASRVVPSYESANGASYLIAQMVDLKTGEILKNKESAKTNGTLIRPETVIATLADALKIQRNIFSPVTEEEPSIKKLLK